MSFDKTPPLKSLTILFLTVILLLNASAIISDHIHGKEKSNQIVDDPIIHSNHPPKDRRYAVDEEALSSVIALGNYTKKINELFPYVHIPPKLKEIRDVLLMKHHILSRPDKSAIYRKIRGGYGENVIYLENSLDKKTNTKTKEQDYIIQFTEKPLITYRLEHEAREGNDASVKVAGAITSKIESHKRKIREVHEESIKKIHNIIKSDKRKVKREFYNVFNGISMTLSPEELEKTKKLDHVKEIYPVTEYKILLMDSVPLINADDVWILSDGYGNNITGINKTIAIIDTGIDYTHTDLGNCNLTITTEGENESYNLESDHPYDNSFNYTWDITRPGYSKIAVHFEKIDVEKGYDHVYVKNVAGDTLASYSGNMSDVWSPSTPGDTIKITLESDSSISVWGFKIDQTLNGTLNMNWDTCSKVVDGYDFVNNDLDPMDDNGHGTHCAGIAAGNGSIKGVAPNAKLYAYKVMDSSGSGYTDDILAAIERAADPNQDNDTSDHVDVISMSLGGSGDPFDALSQAVDNAVDAGVVVVVAAGNDGPEPGTIGSPGCARKAITVGAIYKENDSSMNRLSSLNVISDNNTELDSVAMQYSATTNETGIVAELADAGYGYPENFSGGNYTGKIALIKRGSVNETGFFFYEKVENAYDAGAIGTIIYNNMPGNFKGTLLNLSEIPAVSISQSDGSYLLNLLGNGEVTVNLTVVVDPNIIADFSSRGPAHIYNKPDVLAPGVMICSAQWDDVYSDSECYDSEHAAISGTSMATPHVAGASALILQRHPGWTPLEVKAALENTAFDYGLDVNTQGAGKIDVLKAVQLNTTPPVAFISDVVGVQYI